MAGGEEPGRLIRLAEVAAHNTCHGEDRSVWTVIHDKVYDITDLLVEHPGGEEELIENAAGVDGTESYEDTWPSEDNREMLRSFYIGDLHPEDRTSRVVRMNRFSSREGGQKEERKEDNIFDDWFYIFLVFLLIVIYLLVASFCDQFSRHI